MAASPKHGASTRRLLLAGLLAATATLVAAAVHAQDISTYYTVQHPGEFPINWLAFYQKATAMTATTRKELPHHLDLPYGSDVKQKLDLYLPANKPTHAPVLLFLHGGGFREGDRAQYGYIAEPYSKLGIITAVASYRLTGAGFKYPDQTHDAEQAVKWLYEHAAKYGGDPGHLWVAGHSAGALLVAEIGADRSWMEAAGIPEEALRGFVPVSGRYDIRMPEPGGFTPTKELAEQASPLLHIAHPAPAAIVALGSTEQPILASSREFTEKLRSVGVSSSLVVLSGADHKDAVLALADEHSPLFQAVAAMITAPKVAAR